MGNSKSTADQADQAAEQTAAGVESTPEHQLHSLVTQHPDGVVRFTRPGVESREFTVKDGEIRTTKEGYDWLLRHVVGDRPTAD